VRVFDCRRAPCKGDGRNQANRHDARISHRQACAVSNLRRVPLSRSQGSFPVQRVSEPLLIRKFSRWSCAATGNLGQPSLELSPVVRFQKIGRTKRD
jgi:hypothetical protein